MIPQVLQNLLTLSLWISGILLQSRGGGGGVGAESKGLRKLEISIAAQCECIPRHWQRFVRHPFVRRRDKPTPLPFPRTKGWRRDRRQCPGLLSTLGAASPKSYVCRLEYNAPLYNIQKKSVKKCDMESAHNLDIH